jgi:ABC-type glycerol-3-phosphate transport system substrate-binding protein
VEKDLAYEFARFMTSREVQVRESSKFGLIPVRRDVLTTLPNVFDEGWVGDIFLTSVDQIRINGLTTVPLVPEYSQASRLYVDAWYAICLEPGETKEGIPEFGDMKRRLVTEFPQRRQAILGEETEDREGSEPPQGRDVWVFGARDGICGLWCPRPSI